MPLQAVDPQRLYRQIADQVRALIVSGEFPTGMRLPTERELSEQLGVSRPSVREALIALEVEAWVEVRKGRGIYVRDRGAAPAPTAAAVSSSPAEWGPLEVMRARRLLEGEIAAVAAHEATRQDMTALRNSIAAMKDEIERGEVPLVGDHAFHITLARCSGNVVLQETVQTYWDARQKPLFRRLGAYFESPELARDAIAEHEVILIAIHARDAAAARDAMHAHLDRSMARLSAGWDHADTTPGMPATSATPASSTPMTETKP